MHKLNVKEKYYNLLKSGIKTIELRLFDDKRKNIEVGDYIEFSNSSDGDDKFMSQVIKLHRANNFSELCQKIDCKKAGFSDSNELINILEEFYSQERQKEFGVVGIEIKLV
ncbi:MAG: ASCH domain-containing protein [Alphaproteobacteria bacterium]|nr:ASCH domain-containing protein [Alphaproteobacteria bacterium]